MEQRRGFRITTWNVFQALYANVNQESIRVSAMASRKDAMFEILEADIVVMQETKIQRKDLTDDMVLVPGWDVFFSLPKHKKGYSGVAIYTRNAVCAPIRAEEGITGILTPPNSTTSFRDLPEDQQIGGYPTGSQLSEAPVDPVTLDSEGRCVILEFPAFVLIGTYCPANSSDARDDFRIGFLNALDARVRNLVAAGKRVFLTGDVNISRNEQDTAKLDEQLKKQGITVEDYFSSPARRMFNQLLVGGKVIGERDEGREESVMWDICRSFHPTRKAMYTCWEQKINARPGNFGSRIDYVLCSKDFKDWFCESNIQEGLMGSDHCPVYAVFKDKVEIEGTEVDIRDLMGYGMFVRGNREREWSTKDLLPMSAKLIPEFDRRRSIRDMFTKKPSLSTKESSFSNAGLYKEESTGKTTMTEEIPRKQNLSPNGPRDTKTPPPVDSTILSQRKKTPMKSPAKAFIASPTRSLAASSSTSSNKRPSEASSSTAKPPKRVKSGAFSKTATTSKAPPGRGQSSLIGFFRPKNPQPAEQIQSQTMLNEDSKTTNETASFDTPALRPSFVKSTDPSVQNSESVIASKEVEPAEQKDIIDPIVAKESWSKLLTKRVVPKCDHGEPCVSFLTKKPGVNCGRSFYMCPRPLGPSGKKEKDTQWRCGTFIWSSDWTKDGS
ncbi:DNA-(apurinic or apyrimidinic site) lyase [Lachnellula hyalina]|uniref:DNA-(apurinic or apyrimidinic site) endonuclease 2 n=1 Tax=Lachnellula hyalina TaxID=1316788 RepID=A0A8H8R5H5_9HELO|nr:DNA-(apurinic or apyrimidinic site) lyase [Lachnellula hyalina]TVY28818.1 DNA-(apurinic or apyrimidinic site) lyase [Lachnellula hyalina]